MIGCSRSTCAPHSNKPRHTLFNKYNGKNRVNVSLPSSCVYVNKAPPLTTRRTGLTGSLVLIEGEALGYKPRPCQNLCCLLLPSPGFQTTVRPFSAAVPKFSGTQLLHAPCLSLNRPPSCSHSLGERLHLLAAGWSADGSSPGPYPPNTSSERPTIPYW